MVEVSIIIPIYNAEGTLEKCLNSICNQTFKDIEVLLVNDGSTDSSKKICEQYCKKYAYFRLIDKKNSGPATARNTGIQQAKGKYISFVDADDYVETEMIEIMYSKAEEYSAEMVICNYYEERDGVLRPHKYKYSAGVYENADCLKIAEELIDDVSDTRIPPYSWLRMIKKEVFDKSGMCYENNMVRSEDYYLYVKLHFILKRLVLLSDNYLYHYVEVPTSITHSYVPNYWKSVLTIYRGLYRSIPINAVIVQRLNSMFIRRSMIALNNAGRASVGAVKELDEIIRNKTLKNVIAGIPFWKGFKDFGFFFVLMKLHLTPVVKLYYINKSNRYFNAK